MPFGTSHALLRHAAARGPAAMTHDSTRALCLEPAGATDDQPFGPDVIVFRIGGKIFALLSLDASPPALSLKADPEDVVERQEAFASVGPGYHLNKRHWITAVLDGEVPVETLRAWIADSHARVRASLPARVRATL